MIYSEHGVVRSCHRTTHRYVDLLEHAHAFASVYQGYILWCRYDDCSINRNKLAQRELDIACSRWHVNDQYVEILSICRPVHVKE